VTIDFPYPGYEGIAPVDIPDANLQGVHAPRSMDAGNEESMIEGAVAAPIGVGRLSKTLRAGDRVLILVDDATRRTPVARVLPYVAAELQAAGVPDDRISVLTAQGTHSRMSEPELQHKLGAFRSRFAVHQHAWLDEVTLRDFGRTSDGTRIRGNHLLAEADLVVGIGSIVPHRIKGFSGGAKIAFPGVAGREIQERTQWEASLRRSEDVMGVAETPMRHRIEEAARLVGLRYIVNCVSDGTGRLAGCFAGDVVGAHRAGCELSRAINEVALPARADIVIVDSHPADRDIWQSAKGVYSGTMAVRDGGVLILVAPNPHGVAANHPIMLDVGYRPFPELARLVAERAISDVVGIAILADLAQVMDRVRCILVSPGVTPDEAERIGFHHAGSVQAALAAAFDHCGAGARVAVLRRGGHILPRVAGERHGA
jgi:nickel-dependent lactate racemase